MKAKPAPREVPKEYTAFKTLLSKVVKPEPKRQDHKPHKTITGKA